MYFWNPDDSDNISAIPMIPILPANAVKNVLPFFVMRLFRLNENAVNRLMEVFLGA